MSNIVPFDSAIPAHLVSRVGQPSTLGASIGGGIGGGVEFPRISIKSSRFRIVQDGTETVLPDVTLSVIVVGANPNLSKAFYASAWNPDAEATGPDCFTLEGTRPSPDSPQPQNDLCSTCPHNAWGSKITDAGTKIKACADKKRLAVVAADDPSGAIYLLEVTAAALKGLNQYNKELQMRGIAPEIAKTIVSFDTSASFPKLQFGFGGYLDDATQSVVDGLFGTDKIKEITGEGAVGLVAIPAQTAAPAVSSPVAEEPVVEPVAFGTPTPTETASPAPEPVVKAPTAVTSAFGTPTPTETASPAPEPVAEEPAAAPVAAGTAGLASEITNLMEAVADDA
jgi:hypothetical protein